MTKEEAIIELIYSGKYDDLTCKEARKLFEELIKENRCEDECVSKGTCNHNEICLEERISQFIEDNYSEDDL